MGVSVFIIEKQTESYAEDTTTHADDKSLRVLEAKLQSSANKFDVWRVDHKTFAKLLGSRNTTFTFSLGSTHSSGPGER